VAAVALVAAAVWGAALVAAVVLVAAAASVPTVVVSAAVAREAMNGRVAALAGAGRRTGGVCE
jgi:hypothetical protein